MTQHTIWLPAYFAHDHIERELPYGEIVREGKQGVLIRCNDDELAEWLSDARHYSDCAGPGWDFDNRLAMQASARATVKRIEAMRAEGERA